MLDFFRKIIPQSSYLGVDIGTTSIKIAEIFSDKKKPRFANYSLLEDLGYLERPNTALQTSTLKLFEKEVIEYIKLMIKRGGFQSSNVVASLPFFSSFTTIIEMPLMPEKEMEAALGFRARQYIPLPVSAVTLDWIKVGEREDESGNKKQQVFLIAITNEQVDKYKRIFSGAGLNLVALELEGISLARSITTNSDSPTLIVDLGARSTNLSVARNGLLQFIGQTDFASASLTHAISSGLGINSRRAEDLKKQRGLVDAGLGPAQELSTLMKPILDVTINEVRKLKENYKNTYHQDVQNVVLTGGGAQLLGVEEYFKKELGSPVTKANPFADLSYDSRLDVLMNSLGVLLPVAIGASLRNFKI